MFSQRDVFKAIIIIIIIIEINKDNFGLIVGSEHVFVSISSENVLDKMTKKHYT